MSEWVPKANLETFLEVWKVSSPVLDLNHEALDWKLTTGLKCDQTLASL